MKFLQHVALMNAPQPIAHWPGSLIPHGVWLVQRSAGAWRAWWRGLLPAPVLGNPLHEAWSADGEPRERMTPSALAKSSSTRYLILPTHRGQ